MKGAKWIKATNVMLSYKPKDMISRGDRVD